MKYTYIFCNKSSPDLSIDNVACLVYSSGYVDNDYWNVTRSYGHSPESNCDGLIHGVQNDGIIGYRYTDNISRGIFTNSIPKSIYQYAQEII